MDSASPQEDSAARSAQQLAPLTKKLFFSPTRYHPPHRVAADAETCGYADGLEELAARIDLAADSSRVGRELAGLVKRCSAWPALQELLQRLLRDKRPVLIYGDYDVDGIVSSLLLHRFLRESGVPGNVFLPSRFKHGYGLDRSVIERAIEQGYTTLIALDCGTANLDEVAMASAAGMEVAVIDHHPPKEDSPTGLQATLLNPHLEGSLPPLCTAGLVYGVLHALAEADSSAMGFFGDELELAGIATIADVAPLEQYNWAMAHHALYRLPETVNPGLLELVKASRLHGLARITGRQVSFQIVPRLNAAGRMQSAKLALDLLMSKDHEPARSLCQRINLLNEERKSVSTRVLKEALGKALDFQGDSALVLCDADWHPGVLGIVAARVAGQLGVPALILADAPGRPGLFGGSARTSGVVSLIETLSQCAEQLDSFGGHHAAAGVKLEKEGVDEFRRAWCRAVAASPPADKHDSVAEYPKIGLGELTSGFEADLWRLAPYGAGHPAPRATITGCKVARVGYMGRERTHLNLLITDGERQVRVAGFNQSHLYNQLSEGLEIEPLVEIEPDNWNNRYSMVLRLLEV